MASLNFRIRPTIINEVCKALIGQLTDEKVALLEEMGVSQFLNFPALKQNVALMQNLLDLWIPEQVGFQINGRLAEFSVAEVSMIIGMPNRGKLVKSESNAPLHPLTAQRFRDDLKNVDPASSVEEFGILFLKFLISNVFFISGNYKISSTYFNCVNDVRDFYNYNWPEAIHSHLITQFSNYSLRRSKGVGAGYINGFVTVLFIWFLERSNAIQAHFPNNRPRLLRWITEINWRNVDLYAVLARIEINEGFQDITIAENLLVNGFVQINEGFQDVTIAENYLVNSDFVAIEGPSSLSPPSPNPPTSTPPPSSTPEATNDYPLMVASIEVIRRECEAMRKNQELQKLEMDAMLARIAQLEEEAASHKIEKNAIFSRLAKLEEKAANATFIKKDVAVEVEAATNLEVEDAASLEAEDAASLEAEAAVSLEVEDAASLEAEAAVILLHNLSQSAPEKIDVSITHAVKDRDDMRKLVVWTPYIEKKRKRGAKPQISTTVVMDVDNLEDKVRHAPVILDFKGRSQVGEETIGLLEGYFQKYKDLMYPSSFKKRRFDQEIMDLSDPFAIARRIDELNEEKYGSATKEFEELHAWRMKFINLLPPYLIKPCPKSEPQSLRISLNANGHQSGLCKKVDMLQHHRKSVAGAVIDVDSDSEADAVNPTVSQSYQYERHFYTPVVVRQPPSIQYEKVSFGEKVDVQVNKSPKSQLLTFKGTDDLESLSSLLKKEKKLKNEKKMKQEKKVEKEKIVNVSTSPTTPVQSSVNHSPQMLPQMLHQNQDDVEATESDGLEDLWNDMSLALECSKDVKLSAPIEKEEECCHSFILKDDLGIVCQVCGIIQKSIETIFDFQWTKNTRDARYYASGTRKHEDMDEAVDGSQPNHPEADSGMDLGIDPRHKKLMKPHQIEGFRFLVKNLMVEKPGGCILAHAPGSGKTFMLISFMQSFITQKPDKRPLVVLPKGILSTWKREFQLWQLEDISLFDFYSSKADHRSQQLDILKNWEQSRGILFLGYKQFTNIVSSTSTEKIDTLCREKLLMVPGLVILDEGHTPRNNNTALVQSLSRIKTPRKVVLSGTLFQNHVKEVFNILKLVRPKFMKEESSRNVIKRVLSSVLISAGRRPSKGCKESTFCDLVQETLQNDNNCSRKNSVIKDLREMTHNVLHYYKGDFLDELPGMVDFTVFLKLTSWQKSIASKLHKLDIFKGNSVGSAVYMHPSLKEVAESVDWDKNESLSSDKVDGLIGSLNVRDGVKTKFFLDILSLSESAGEKLLVFSQYILPLKFLERLVIQKKGWRLGKEVFMISGDSNPEDRERSMDQFNNSADARVLFGSIKACGEGISLVGASRILILDVHLNPSVTRQAIGRAFRPGQRRKVYTYRLVAADSPEEEHHKTSFKKEIISKVWFECNDYSGHKEIDLHEVELADSDDIFFESPALIEDIKNLYKR